MDQTGTETQRQQLHPSQVGQATDKSGYRLFPVADQRQQVSPKTLQKQTLGRAGSINKRRSVSLDDASRRDALTRTPFARTGNNPVPRIQAVPPNRSKITKASLNGNNTSSRAPQVLPYKPRVADDGGHGRSSSAPGDIIREGSREKNPNGRAPVANAALLKAPKPLHGPGETWYDDKSRDSVVESKHESRHRLRNSALDQKPLPPPPQSSDGRTHLDVSHGRSQSTPLSPTPGSGFPVGLRSDSVTDLVPLVTPSSLDPNRKSYFPLSKDAQMRRLMGMSPIDDAEDDFAAFHARQKAVIAQNPMPSLTLPASRYQKALPALVIPERKDSASAARKQAEVPRPVPAPKDLKAEAPVPAEDKTPTPPSPTFSQASRSLKPAALKIGAPKRSVSVSSSLDRRTLQVRTHIAREVQKIKPLVQKPSPKVDPMATVIASVLDLTEEMDALCTRYASLREARQDLSAAITQGLREQKPGPEYVNTLLDQHMSLSTICSSMDICLAKIKALNRKKDSLLTSAQTQAKASLSSIDEAKVAPTASSTKPPASTPPPDTTILQNTVYVPPLRTHHSTDALSRKTPMSAPTQHTKRFDREYDTSDSDTPRRLNVKGAKAAKILGLEIDTPSNDPAKTSDPFSQRPTQLSSKANLSTTSLDRDLFTRNPIPAPERPLPARPTFSQRKASPTPLDTSMTSSNNKNINTTTTTPPNPAHAAQNSIGTSSSRASSPAEDRGAETPQHFPPPHQSAAFDDAKSPSMQTVHVYFPEGEAMGLGMPTRTMTKSSRVASSTYSSTFSEIGEDELLEYYGYLN